MAHAASPSLISVGLTNDASLEGSSFRGGLAVSCVLHALVLVMAMFIRLHSESEQPFRAIDVALISLPGLPTTAPSPKPVPPRTKKPAKAQAPQKVAPPVPAEDTLPPLPTETASERLSESLSGAINSILVPQKQEAPSATVPPKEKNIQPKEDQSPLIDNLRLPSAPPTIARPKQLKRSEPLKIPSTMAPPSKSVPKKTQAPSKPQPLESPKTEARVQPAMKPAPAVPSLSEVTPFKRSQQTTPPSNTLPSSKMEESLKRNLPKIPTPTPAPNVPKISRKQSTTRQKPKSSTQPKMSETVKKLMEGLKSTTRRPTPKEIPSQLTKPSPKVTPSELDQRIAKLSIPDVAPVESIKQRLQLLEVQATGNPGRSASKPSPGKNRYLAMVEDVIDGQWVAPPLLSSTPLVVMKFRISRSGEISRIQIAESSGHGHYDSAAQRAVQAVNPLPPFPSDISDSFFDVQYRFIKD